MRVWQKTYEGERAAREYASLHETHYGETVVINYARSIMGEIIGFHGLIFDSYNGTFRGYL